MHPVFFQIGSFTVYSYGLFVALAMGISFWICDRRAAGLGLERSMVADMIFLLFISGVAGARIFFVLQHFSDYTQEPWRIFFLQEGGLVWYGGFFLASICGAFYAMRRHWPLLSLCDFFSPVLPLAHAVGRLGCFFNGCCYGRFTSSKWGMTFPFESHPRIPIQLYESALLLFLSLLLFFLSTRKKRPGEIFTIYIILYAILRFCVEFLRGDQMPIKGLTLPQWTSTVLAAGAVFLFFFLRRKSD
jgi:phosphatidylglycerol:prolipoprotein diacylglycerol transferase